MKAYVDSHRENLRGVFVVYKGKTLGPFPYPFRKGFVVRNMLDTRVVLSIDDDSILNDIIMTNKSHTNLDKLDEAIKYFIKSCGIFTKLTYKTDLGKAFATKENTFFEKLPGVKNLSEYFNSPDEYINEQIVPQMTPENQERYRQAVLGQELENVETSGGEKETGSRSSSVSEKETLSPRVESPTPPLPDTAVDTTTSPSVSASFPEVVHELVPEVVPQGGTKPQVKTKSHTKESQPQERYRKWKCAAYIGILDCHQDLGIKMKDRRVRLHFGITSQDPNKRDSGGSLGARNGWRRIHYAPLNEEGSKKSKDKRKVEYAVKDELEKIAISHDISFDTVEYIDVHISKFQEVLNVIRTTISQYEEWF